MNPTEYPVVLLHGLACDPYLWETTEEHLQRAGFEIYQPLMRNQDSISKMAEFVLEEVEGNSLLGDFQWVAMSPLKFGDRLRSVSRS